MVIRLVVTRVEVLELCNQLVLACLRWFAKQEVVCCAVTFNFNVCQTYLVPLKLVCACW